MMFPEIPIERKYTKNFECDASFITNKIAELWYGSGFIGSAGDINHSSKFKFYLWSIDGPILRRTV